MTTDHEPEVLWTSYVPPTPVDVARALKDVRQAGAVTEGRVRDHYTLLHLPVMLQFRTADSRARAFVELLRWVISHTPIEAEYRIIAKWSFFPPQEPAALNERYTQAAAEIERHVPPAAGTQRHNLSHRQVIIREDGVIQLLAERLLDSTTTAEWEALRILPQLSSAPANHYNGTDIRWLEWRVVLDRRADPEFQHCYHNVLIRALRSPNRFYAIGDTKISPDEVGKPRLYPQRRGHRLIIPVRGPGTNIADAVYFGRSLNVDDVERIKYRRTFEKHQGAMSWVDHCVLSGWPHLLDLRILLSPDEPIRRWCEEIWSDRSATAELLHCTEHRVAGAQPRCVSWRLGRAEVGKYHRLVIYPV